MLFQVLLEPEILIVDSVLLDVRDESQTDEPTEEAQRTRDEEGILALLNRAISSSSNDVGKDVGTHKGTNFANRSGNGVVLPTDGSGTCLGSNEANVVAGAELAK